MEDTCFTVCNEPFLKQISDRVISLWTSNHNCKCEEVGFFFWQLRCWVLSWIFRWWLIYQLNKGVMCHVNNTEVTGLENLISHSTCIKTSWASFSCLEFFLDCGVLDLRCFSSPRHLNRPISDVIFATHNSTFLYSST